MLGVDFLAMPGSPHKLGCQKRKDKKRRKLARALDTDSNVIPTFSASSEHCSQPGWRGEWKPGESVTRQEVVSVKEQPPSVGERMILILVKNFCTSLSRREGEYAHVLIWVKYISVSEPTDSFMSVIARITRAVMLAKTVLPPNIHTFFGVEQTEWTGKEMKVLRCCDLCEVFIWKSQNSYMSLGCRDKLSLVWEKKRYEFTESQTSEHLLPMKQSKQMMY